MTLMRFDPFRDLDRISEQLMAGQPMRAMPMEAFRRGDTFYVALDLPGVDPDDTQVTVEGNIVSVRAIRRAARQDSDEVLIDERRHGEFSRQLFLGDNLDASKLTADYDRGVLTLTIPVAEQSKPRRVQIAGGSGPRTVEATSSTPSSSQRPSTTDAQQTAPASA